MPIAAKGHRPVRTRIAKGLAANMLGKVWVILSQLVGVPVLTSVWGASGYGVWLMVTTVPTYVALTSLGFGAAAAIDMTQKYSVGDHSGALKSFQSISLLIGAALGAVLLIACAEWAGQDFLLHLLKIEPPPKAVVIAAYLLVIYAVVAVWMTVIAVGYQSTGRYAEGTILLDCLTPVETAVILLAALAGYGLAGAAVGMLVVRALGALGFYSWLRRREPWIRLGWDQASWAEVKRLTHPALGSLSLTLGSALSLQGLIVALGLVISPSATAVFATARLLTRFPLQIVGLTSRATLPEMTAAYAMKQHILSAKLALMNLITVLVIVLPATVVFIAIGPFALHILSHAHLTAGRSLFVWLSLAAACQALWTTVSQFLFAMNRQHKVAHYYLVLAAVTTAAPLFVPRSAALPGVSFVWAAAEGVMLAIVARRWWTEAGLSSQTLDQALRALGLDLAHLGRRLLAFVGNLNVHAQK